MLCTDARLTSGERRHAERGIADVTSLDDKEHLALAERAARARRAIRRQTRAALSNGHRLLSRIDVLSASRPVSMTAEVLLLILVPLLTFGAVLLLTSIAGVAHVPGCNSANNFIASLSLQRLKPSTCVAVPFLSDVPTVILSFTSPFAMVGYRLLRRRLTWIVSAVSETGLVERQELRDVLTQAVQRLEVAIDLTLPRRIILFLLTAALTTWLYTRYLIYGHLFDLLARAHSGQGSAAELRASWWANYHHHLFLAALCIFIGTVGVYYAFRAGWLYLRLAAMLVARRKYSGQALRFDYVPRWKDKSYGWSPVTGALFMIYLSTVNFAVSMAAVFDMLQGKTWTIGVAAFFVALGILANLLITLTSFLLMIGAHRAVELRLRSSLTSAMALGHAPENSLADFFAATDLVAWRRIPVASAASTTLKIAPGIYAFIQFVARVLVARH
jgi:hypothetical protein